MPGASSPSQVDLVAALFKSDARPGRRLTRTGLEPLGALLGEEGMITRIAASVLGNAARPVRALLLDKSEEANWQLPWHQDRTIAVVERVEVEGYGPWSVKVGQLHVQPPDELLERMLTLRIQVDPVDVSNGPLSILPGSHRLGRLSEPQIEELAAGVTAFTCHAAIGDVWIYPTLVVYSSAAAEQPRRRRVLQIDYSADDLPGQLRWAHAR